jgi:hypothetical protein
MWARGEGQSQRLVREERLLHLRVLRLSFLQDGDVGIGIPPEGEKIFVGGERPDAGSVGICTSRSSRLQRVRTRHAQMRQRSCPAVQTMPLWSRIFWNSAAACVPCPAARYTSPRT